MRKYDYSFLKSSIPGNIIGIAGIVADLKSKESIRKFQNKETFEKLRHNAIIESVKGSNAIEGIITTDERIKDIVSGEKPLNHNEEEISGYKDVLQLIHSEYNNLDLTEEIILRFHSLITGTTSPSEAGRYKFADNLIMEFTAEGQRRVRFKPVKAEETSQSVEQLLLAYYDARQDSEIPDLLLIPCVVLDFLCIHPFTDGNGRVSRLITLLLLYRHGYDIGRYISFEGQINKYKEAYYSSLELSSVNWHENKNDYIPFITNFLQILYRCYKDLDDQFMLLSLKKAKKSERVEAVILNALVPVSKSEIVEKLPDVSVKTVELTLNNLIKEGKIKKIGTFKNARYFKA